MSNNIPRDFKNLKKTELIELLEAHWSKIQSVEASLTEISNINLEEVRNSVTSITNLENTANEKNEEIKSFHENISDKTRDIDGLSDKINSFHKELEKLAQEKKDLFGTFVKEKDLIMQRIEGLLPAATSAGLASSYTKALEIYRANNDEGWWEWVKFKNLFHSSKMLWLMFVAATAVLSGWYCLSFWTVRTHTIGNILATVSTGFPLIWLAWFLQKSISQRTRLFEEYNHKIRVMSLYEGFSRIIEDSNPELKANLLNIILKTVSENPANSLGKSETIMESLLSKIIDVKKIKKEIPEEK